MDMNLYKKGSNNNPHGGINKMYCLKNIVRSRANANFLTINPNKIKMFGGMGVSVC